jgi:hypothetical protein
MRPSHVTRYTAIFFLFGVADIFGQVNSGEPRLKIGNPSGLRVKASALLVSTGNKYSIVSSPTKPIKPTSHACLMVCTL